MMWHQVYEAILEALEESGYGFALTECRDEDDTLWMEVGPDPASSGTDYLAIGIDPDAMTALWFGPRNCFETVFRGLTKDEAGDRLRLVTQAVVALVEGTAEFTTTSLLGHRVGTVVRVGGQVISRDGFTSAANLPGTKNYIWSYEAFPRTD